jgi:malonyl-CoA/methylmalonyl-CoA synthetase
MIGEEYICDIREKNTDMANQTLNDLFLDSFSTHGKKTAVSFFKGDRLESEISYTNLTRDSNRLANTFASMGVAKGDRVILYFEKSLIFVVAYLALLKIGAIAVPLNPGFKENEMEYLVNDADPSLILYGPEQETTVKNIAPQKQTLMVDTNSPYQDQKLFNNAYEVAPEINIEPEDPGLIIYTSGTTGKPKGAVLTHLNLVNDAENITAIWEINETDVLCHVLPLFHIHGLCFALHTALLSGTHVILLDRFSPPRVFEHLTKKEGDHVCSVFMAVPPMYTMLMDHIGERAPDFAHIRLLTSGSAPLLVKEFERIKRIFGREPIEREGMSETGVNFSNPLKGVKKPGSIGLPLPGLNVRIMDPETLNDVPQGEEGEIWLMGRSISPGYWRKPEETSKAFEGGWFRTGDLGKVDEDGYYYLTDRLKHIIISGGENVSPKEIEEVINQLDGVIESSVLGIADEKWGEKIVAAVVVREGDILSDKEIQAHCKRFLHNWKCPKEIFFLSKLPRNTMGKVLKEEVEKIFLS